MQTRALSCWIALCLAACGAAPAPPTARRREVGADVRSFLTGSDLVVAVDHRTARGLGLAAELGTVYSLVPLVDRIMGHIPVDLVADVDAVAVGARETRWSGGPTASRWRVVLHHRLGAEATARLEAGARAIGETTDWRESQGLRSARLPGEATRTVPHALMLAAPSVAVVFPEDEILDVLTTARDHEARREATDEPIEPALAFDPGVLASATATALPDAWTQRGATSAEATLRADGAVIRVRLVVHFARPEDAEAARAEADGQLAGMRGNALVASFGVAGLVDRLALHAEGADGIAETEGSAAEIGAALRAIALLLAS